MGSHQQNQSLLTLLPYMTVMNAGNIPDYMKHPHSRSGFVCRLGTAFRAPEGVKGFTSMWTVIYGGYV